MSISSRLWSRSFRRRSGHDGQTGPPDINTARARAVPDPEYDFFTATRRGTGLPSIRSFSKTTDRKATTMPIILWFLGVPLSIVLLLMLFGVIGF